MEFSRLLTAEILLGWRTVARIYSFVGVLQWFKCNFAGVHVFGLQPSESGAYVWDQASGYKKTSILNMDGIAPSSLTRCWPLDPEGPLPPVLFSSEYLTNVFFQFIPAQWDCLPSTVRKGLKKLLRRAAPDARTDLSLEAEARDQALVRIACDNPRVRGRIRDLELSVNEEVLRRGRPTGRQKIMQPRLPIHELFWSEIRNDQNSQGVVESILKIAIKRAGMGERLFLTAQCLKDGAENFTRENVSSIVFARSVISFAAVLPQPEMVELLAAASELGCECLDDGKPASLVSSERLANSTSTELHQDREVIVVQAPRLESVPESAVRAAISEEYVPSAKAKRLIDDLRATASRYSSTVDETRTAFPISFESLTSLPPAEFKAWMSRARDGHAQYRAMISALSDCSNAAVELFRRTFAALQLSAPVWASSQSDSPALSDVENNLLIADEVASLSQLALGRQRDLDGWFSAVPFSRDGTNALEMFRELPRLCMLADQKLLAENKFVTDAKAFLSRTSPSEATEWLKSLGCDEVLCLLGSLDLTTWPVPASVLFRLGLDQKNEIFIAAASRILTSCEDVQLVRDLLHFCSPSSTLFDSHVPARRIVAVERFRDIINLGPVALLTDPSSGLSDADVVGSTVAELVDLLNSHLALFESGAALRELANIGEKKALRSGEELKAFISTPSSMSGIFRLLRECARERFFVPLLKRGVIDREAAIELLGQLRSSDIYEAIISDALDRSGRHTRIEARHRIQLERYLAEGINCLSAYAASFSDEDARMVAFRKELATLFGHLRSGSKSRGDVIWLEGAVRSILGGRAFVPSSQTLQGQTVPLSETSWRSSDTIWAQRSINLSEFYLEQECDPLVVCLASLSKWSAGLKPQLEDIVSQLIGLRAFPAALQAVQELASDAQKEALVRSVVAEFEQESKSIIERLSRLAALYGQESVSEASIKPSIDRALASYDLDEASEYLDLLEFELSERQGASGQAIEDGAQRKELLQLLLLAGVVGLEEGVSVHDLQRRWEVELQRRESERVHLKAVEDALTAADVTLPDFVPHLLDFKRRNLRADRWLPPERAESLAVFMRDAITKLRTWTESAAVFEHRARLSLIALAEWFIRFLEERVETVRTFGAGESIDDVLERMMEVCDCIGHSADPGACLFALEEIGELVNRSDVNQSRTEEPLGASLELYNCIKIEDWSALIKCAQTLSDTSPPGERSRFDELKAFGETMIGLINTKTAAEGRGLLDAARVLGVATQPVYQALSQKRLLELAYQIIASSLAVEERMDTISSRPERDDSWADLLSKRPELYRSLGATSTGRTAKIIEQLCAGALGMEVVDRIWNAVTNVSDVGALRASFLSFLHDHELDRHVLALAGRHEPNLRGRLEQLLELRAVSTSRTDLVPVAQLLAEQLTSAAKTVPFRNFMRSLPLTALTLESDLRLTVEDRVILRSDRNGVAQAQVSIVIEPIGLVPEKVEVSLFPEDDVAFDDGSRRKVLAEVPVYASVHSLLPVSFGEGWKTKAGHQDNFRIRVSARLVTGELLNKDAVCELTRVDRSAANVRRVDNDTLLESYPGVENTPAAGDAFIGRVEELERLNDVLVSARRPSPVLLTGMRRIGKTSLLFAFHERNRLLDRTNAVTVYLSLAEKRSQFMDSRTSVSSVFFGAISHALGKRHFSAADHNRIIGEKIQAHFDDEPGAAKRAIQSCHEPESLADSIVVLCERLLQWIGGFAERVIFLIDEAETLVVPYRAGGPKRLELEQLLQSLREISQTSSSVGILLCGSNHIAEFSKQYKNAFFGSCVEVQLGGITEFELARRIVAPSRLAPFVSFQDQAIHHAIDLCAGTPQFMWQVGAASTAMVRSGPITRVDVRQAVALLMDDRSIDLPFKAYDVLEPLEYMLGLHGVREQDLYWILLWRAAFGSSLANEQVQQHFIIDAELLQIESAEAWRDRLLALVELGILEIPRPSMYRFRVPIFAEAFRAPKHRHSYLVRLQRVAN